jgi:hypothetical protein
MTNLFGSIFEKEELDSVYFLSLRTRVWAKSACLVYTWLLIRQAGFFASAVLKACASPT